MKKIISFISGLLFLFSMNSAVFCEDEAIEQDEYTGKIYMEGEFLNGDLLKLSVSSDDMVYPIIGIAFHLVYDSQSLAFLKYEPGKFLERGGDPFYLVKNEEGKIFFGETLRRDDNFPIDGDVIADFYLRMGLCPQLK
jgi:hypothetical protein